MAEISAALVKSLRERTGAGMMDCKRALQQSDGDVETAIDWLRMHGLSAAAKRSGRATAEGLIGVRVEGCRGAMVEVNSETDFVGRNELFREFVQIVTRLALQANGDRDALLASSYPHTDQTVAGQMTHLIATVGENMSISRVATLRVDHGTIGSYVHAAQGEGIGRIGVLVALHCERSSDQLTQFAKQLAMHVAAAAPLALTRDALPPQVLERERKVALEQAQTTGKPAHVLEKIVEGRLAKFFQEVCLLDQTYVLDGETKVADVLKKTSQGIGASVSVTGFLRFALGQGVEPGNGAEPDAPPA